MLLTLLVTWWLPFFLCDLTIDFSLHTMTFFTKLIWQLTFLYTLTWRLTFLFTLTQQMTFSYTWLDDWPFFARYDFLHTLTLRSVLFTVIRRLTFLCTLRVLFTHWLNESLSLRWLEDWPFFLCMHANVDWRSMLWPFLARSLGGWHFYGYQLYSFCTFNKLKLWT